MVVPLLLAFTFTFCSSPSDSIWMSIPFERSTVSSFPSMETVPSLMLTSLPWNSSLLIVMFAILFLFSRYPVPGSKVFVSVSYIYIFFVKCQCFFVEDCIIILIEFTYQQRYNGGKSNINFDLLRIEKTEGNPSVYGMTNPKGDPLYGSIFLPWNSSGWKYRSIKSIRVDLNSSQSNG